MVVDDICNIKQGVNTALHLASINGLIAVVELLLQREADVESQADVSISPLFFHWYGW